MWCHYTFVVYLFVTTVILEEFAEVDAIAEGTLSSIGVRLAPPCCQLDHCTDINWEICKRTIGSCVGYCALIEVSLNNIVVLYYIKVSNFLFIAFIHFQPNPKECEIRCLTEMGRKDCAICVRSFNSVAEYPKTLGLSIEYRKYVI